MATQARCATPGGTLGPKSRQVVVAFCGRNKLVNPFFKTFVDHAGHTPCARRCKACARRSAEARSRLPWPARRTVRGGHRRGSARSAHAPGRTRISRAIHPRFFRVLTSFPTSPTSSPGGLPETSSRSLACAFSLISVRFASKKQGGSSSNGRDSNPKFLGIKKYGGEHVGAGAIIARQRGTKWWCGANCGIGVDHTVYSLISGRVHFTDAHDKYKPGKKIINVVPHEDWPATLAKAQQINAARRTKKAQAQ